MASGNAVSAYVAYFDYVTSLGPRHDRLAWMDLLRGVAVILVVLNHAVLFTVGSFQDPPELAVMLNAVFAPARMPLMVFLSGLLLQRSLAKGPSRHLAGKMRAVLYPLAVWTVIVLTYDVVTATLQRESYSFPGLMEFAFTPPGHVWFLQYLFIYYVVALSLYLIPSWALVVVGLTACALAPHEWDRFFLLFAFFFLGHAAAERPRLLANLSTGRASLIVCAAVALALPVMALMRVDLRYDILSAPFVVAAILLSIRFGQVVAGSRGAVPLEFAGRLSLVFYLAHWFPTLATVLAIGALLPDHPYISVTAAVIVGLAASSAVAFAYERFAFVRAFFVWPGRKVNVRRDSL